MRAPARLRHRGAAGAVSSASADGPLEARSPRADRRWWVAAALAGLIGFALLSWPLALHLDRFWSLRGNSHPVFQTRPGALAGGDQLQTMFIQAEVAGNVLHLREPYLDLSEGAGGPAPLTTASLDVPWIVVTTAFRPLIGLLAAYNLTLLLSSVATAVCAFGWLRRHARLQALALLGALAYACSPNRTYQLTAHFNAVMWWAFPAALWALEVALERFRTERSWVGPICCLAGVVALVSFSGEFHHSLYITALVVSLAAWHLGAAALARKRLPLGPVAAAVVIAGIGALVTLLTFRHVFRGSVAGNNGQFTEVLRYAPPSILAMVTKDFGVSGEGMIYVGVPLLALAAIGLVVAARGRPSMRPYAVLALPLVALTYGPTIRAGAFSPYRLAFDHLPFLHLQRVPERLMVVTALVLVGLAVTGADGLLCALRQRLVSGKQRRIGRPLIALALLAAAALLLADYRISPTVLAPDVRGNPVVARLRASGHDAGPFLGLPVLDKTTTWNSTSTYLAALSERSTLNAYNQTAAPWLDQRLATLAPLNRGDVTHSALAELDRTGARQVVVIDEPHAFLTGEWRSTVDALVSSGAFEMIVAARPLALLERVGPPPK